MAKGFRWNHWIKAGVLLIILVAMLGPLRRYFHGFFFYPDSDIWGSPAEQGIDFEEVFFPSVSANKLNGYFLKPKGSPKGTIVHCHGNAGNITNHYNLTLFLVEAGYNVLCFDYGGYGKSEGSPTPKSIVEDAHGAVDYVRSRPDVDPAKIGLFGQSLGGAAAASAMARDPGIRCLLLEGTFTTYREMAWATGLGKMLFFITPFVIPNKGPVRHLKDIAPRPLLIVHGTEDHIIPVQFAHKLYKKAGHKKALSIIEGLQHLQGEYIEEYKKGVLEFFDRHLGSS